MTDEQLYVPAILMVTSYVVQKGTGIWANKRNKYWNLIEGKMTIENITKTAHFRSQRIFITGIFNMLS